MSLESENDGRPREQDALAGLTTRLKGPLFVPGDAGYEEARTVWNAMIDSKPAVVARADVIACSNRTRPPRPAFDYA